MIFCTNVIGFRVAGHNSYFAIGKAFHFEVPVDPAELFKLPLRKAREFNRYFNVVFAKYDLHDTQPFSASKSASISALLRCSVTQISMAFPSSGSGRPPRIP